MITNGTSPGLRFLVACVLAVAAMTCLACDDDGTGTEVDDTGMTSDVAIDTGSPDTGSTDTSTGDDTSSDDVGDEDDTRMGSDAPDDTSRDDTSSADTSDVTSDMNGDLNSGRDTTDTAEVVDMMTMGTRGTCITTGDCGGRECVTVGDVDRPWHTCSAVPAETTSCTTGMPPDGTDACCTSSDCTDGDNGGCFVGPLWYCGGIQPQPSNVCVYDECSSDAECTDGDNGVCVPTGAFNEHRAICVYGSCVEDADCTRDPSGQCMPFFSPCTNRFAGFHCTYDQSECRTDADCSGIGGYCAPGENGDTSCETFMPPP